MYGPFIDGLMRSSLDPARIERASPSDGVPLEPLPVGSAGDADLAVQSGRAAFERGAWSDAPPSVKRSILHGWADLIENAADELDRLDAKEMGKPISTRMGSAASAARIVRFHAEAIDKIHGDVFPSDARNFVAERWCPRGVVAAVTPWNFPTSNAIRKLAPALAAGNSVVIKPSEVASQSAFRLAELASQAGLPNGVFNLVPGLGRIVGTALASHPDVDMVTFTGSTEVGKSIAGIATASGLKPIIAECGGKSPQILFDDGVDLDMACNAIADFLLTNQGQICSVGSRLLVQESIEAEVLERIGARIEGIVAGHPLDTTTTYGPLASRRQLERVLAYVDNGRREGASLIAGGSPFLEESNGCYMKPTIFRNVDPQSQLAQDEIFGPVLSVMAFDSIEEAISLANTSRFGLTAYVWTTRIATGMRIARSLKSSVWVNGTTPGGEGAGFSAPIEPSGLSGMGVEGGLAGIQAYMRRQSIHLCHG